MVSVVQGWSLTGTESRCAPMIPDMRSGAPSWGFGLKVPGIQTGA